MQREQSRAHRICSHLHPIICHQTTKKHPTIAEPSEDSFSRYQGSRLLLSECCVPARLGAFATFEDDVDVNDLAMAEANALRSAIMQHGVIIIRGLGRWCFLEGSARVVPSIRGIFICDPLSQAVDATGPRGLCTEGSWACRGPRK